MKKLNNLKRTQKPEPLIPNNDEFVINLSSVTLLDEEKRVLSYELNYAFPSRKPKLHDFLAPTERLCQSLKKDHTISDDRWTEFTDHLRSYLHKTKHFNLFVNKKQQIQYDKDMDILRRLLDNKNIIILCRPDKGNAVVVLNKSDYITKMETILNDKSKFHEVHDDALKLSISLENKIYRFITEIKRTLEYNKVTTSSLHITGSHPDILYGVPKIHKTSVPMRSILSCIGTHNLFLSRFTVKLLQPLIKKTYISRDCYYFLDDLKQANIPPTSIMSSFDVESLFTNIPVNETIDIITSLAFPEGVHNYSGFSKKQFV